MDPHLKKRNSPGKIGSRPRVTAAIITGFVLVGALIILIGRAASPVIGGPWYATLILILVIALFAMGSFAIVLVRSHNR